MSKYDVHRYNVEVVSMCGWCQTVKEVTREVTYLEANISIDTCEACYKRYEPYFGDLIVERKG